MPLSVDDIKDILKGEGIAPKNQMMIQRAIQHEERVRFHSEMSLSKEGVSEAYKTFIKLVSKLLPKDKLEMFKTLFQFPVATVPLMDEVYTYLRKVFDGRNPVTTYDFLNKDFELDWMDFRETNLSERFWEDKGYEMMKSGINSLVMVDLPTEQEGERPEPYTYFVPLKNVVALQDIDGVEIEWVLFNLEDGKLGVFDDTSYRVFKLKEGYQKDIEVVPEVENLHDLGYCPSRFFWTSGINNMMPMVKKSPLSTYLGKLDMLLFYEIANEHLNLFARFPIYSAFAEDCEYEVRETGYHCVGGSLMDRNGAYILDGQDPKECPSCSKKKFNGPGAYVTIEPPSRLNEGADLRNPVQITSIPKDSLDYNNEDIADRRAKISNAITGFQGMSINNKAVNEKQVTAIFESLEAALKMPQKNFEKVIKWVESTACRLRYGKDVFQGMNLSLGTEHYIMSSNQLLELYLSHKEQGAPFGVLDMWEDRYYESEYRNDPLRMERYEIEKNLDPLRHIDNDDALIMCEGSKIDRVTYLTKVNLSSFVLRFERENGISIIDFGANVDLGKKIESIKAAFEVYANEMLVVEKVAEIVE